MQVNIYDKVNGQWLLGTMDSRVMPAPDSAPCGRFRVATARVTPVRYCPDLYAHVGSIRVDHIELEYAGYETPPGGDGWIEHQRMVSGTPIDVLMRHPKFRLPGESDAQYGSRRYYC